MTETPRYPGYDVLAKRHTPSWDATTRRVVDQRLATPRSRASSRRRMGAADALCRRIVPQTGDGRRCRWRRCSTPSCSPTMATASARRHALHARGLAAGAGGARCRSAGAHDGRGFAALTDDEQDALLRAMQQGEVEPSAGAASIRKPSSAAHPRRCPGALLRHPTAWNEIGFGGPASPRGYVRLDGDRRDPWEAAEANAGREARPRGRTAMSSDPVSRAARASGRAPDVFRRGGWVPMREHRETTRSISPSSAPARAAARWRPAGRAGLLGRRVRRRAYFRPLEDFASDETEQNKLYWTDKRVVDGANPIQMGGKNSGKAVGGSTVHYAMVSLRFRPEHFSARTSLGYGADWPIAGARCGTITTGRAADRHRRAADLPVGSASARAIRIARTS